MSDFLLFLNTHWQLAVIFIAILALVLLESARASGNLDPHSIKPQELVLMKDKVKLHLFDIRPKTDFEQQHIKHAVHASSDDLAATIEKGAHDKEGHAIVVICQDGTQSFQAALGLRKVLKAGKVYTIDGGFDRWLNELFPVISSDRNN